MKRLLLVVVLTALPLMARADELSDLKAQLDAAIKSMQTLQKRVEALKKWWKDHASSIAVGLALFGALLGVLFR